MHTYARVQSGMWVVLQILWLIESTAQHLIPIREHACLSCAGTQYEHSMLWGFLCRMRNHGDQLLLIVYSPHKKACLCARTHPINQALKLVHNRSACGLLCLGWHTSSASW